MEKTREIFVEKTREIFVGAILEAWGMGGGGGYGEKTHEEYLIRPIRWATALRASELCADLGQTRSSRRQTWALTWMGWS